MVPATSSQRWESEKPGGGEFLRPEGIAVDAAGDIYVADSGNHRIQKFDSSGKYLTMLGVVGLRRRGVLAGFRRHD